MNQAKIGGGPNEHSTKSSMSLHMQKCIQRHENCDSNTYLRNIGLDSEDQRQQAFCPQPTSIYLCERQNSKLAHTLAGNNNMSSLRIVSDYKAACRLVPKVALRT